MKTFTLGALAVGWSLAAWSPWNELPVPGPPHSPRLSSVDRAVADEDPPAARETPPPPQAVVPQHMPSLPPPFQHGRGRLAPGVASFVSNSCGCLSTTSTPPSWIVDIPPGASFWSYTRNPKKLAQLCHLKHAHPNQHSPASLQLCNTASSCLADSLGSHDYFVMLAGGRIRPPNSRLIPLRNSTLDDLELWVAISEARFVPQRQKILSSLSQACKLPEARIKLTFPPEAKLL